MTDERPHVVSEHINRVIDQACVRQAHLRVPAGTIALLRKQAEKGGWQFDEMPTSAFARGVAGPAQTRRLTDESGGDPAIHDHVPRLAGTAR